MEKEQEPLGDRVSIIEDEKLDYEQDKGDCGDTEILAMKWTLQDIIVIFTDIAGILSLIIWVIMLIIRIF